MGIDEEEITEQRIDEAGKNPTPEQIQAFLDKQAKLKEAVKARPQLDGVESENMHILGAILFASKGDCVCKACVLLAEIAGKTVDFMVDGIIKQKETTP